jgi:CRISPR-associated protein Cas1
LLNTLYVTTPRAYLHLDHDTVRVDVDRQTTLRVPLIHLEAIVCFGDILVSAALIHRCGEDGRGIVFLDRNGRFKAALAGPASGNVLLRRAQHLALSDLARTEVVARNVVAGKIQNARQVVLRAAREAATADDTTRLRETGDGLAEVLLRLRAAKGLDVIRGCEGDAGRIYFDTFDCMVRTDRHTFSLPIRSRRPPRDPLNAVLSFLYALVLNDCRASLESVGLDPQVGYLHALRPGRPALALDLLEELRPVVADRLALSLINRRQLTSKDFDEYPGGAVLLADRGRREVVTAYQKRKQDTVRHPVLDRSVPVGLIPHVQARMLARHLRGDLDAYLPFLWR